jgi:hypothetical protein
MVIGGGVSSTSQNFVVRSSFPQTNNVTWNVTIKNIATTNQAGQIVVHAVCATVAP